MISQDKLAPMVICFNRLFYSILFALHQSINQSINPLQHNASPFLPFLIFIFTTLGRRTSAEETGKMIDAITMEEAQRVLKALLQTPPVVLLYAPENLEINMPTPEDIHVWLKQEIAKTEDEIKNKSNNSNNNNNNNNNNNQR